MNMINRQHEMKHHITISIAEPIEVKRKIIGNLESKQKLILQ